MLAKTKTLLLFAITALAMQSCGFQLRSISTLPASINPVYIQGLGLYDPLRIELAHLLKSGATATTTNMEAAGSILHITDRNSSRRVLSVDGKGKVAEYELHEGLQLRLVDPTKTELVATQSVSDIKSYINTEDEVLGKQQEEEMLRKVMRRDLAGRILRRLQSQLK